ncbi:Arginase/deacetylase [Thozetella sp. PMI_491]|nr:Arginase/deacetylase [Thozetella sp. PMI_491]
MASGYSPSPSSSTRGANVNRDLDSAGDQLSNSLKHLSLSTSAINSPRSGRHSVASSPFKPAVDRSPSTPRPSSALRSPLNGMSTPSRSATPTLLRKASMNSLHSANGVAPPRRASSVNILSPSSGRSPLSSVSPEVQTPAPPTANSVASKHFAAELEAFHGANTDQSTETIVFLHDACYGHRYSRPRTSRASLNTIVERPERIKASVMGVSAAYVRLGERHQDGAFPPGPGLSPALIPTIPFRIQKTSRRVSLGSQAVTNVHGTKWMEELKIMCDSAEAKLTINGKELQRPDMDRGPGAEPPKKFHEGDLYLCAESLDALEGSLGGVCDAVDTVFSPQQGPKRAFVAIRPPGHHCSASFPSGFCWINNVHVGIMHAILSHGLTHAAIIDFDLHHGDGSQSVAWQHNARSVGLPKNAAWWKKTSIGYFSLHDINSYPCEGGDEEKVKNASLCIDNAHGQNIWNVHLQPWSSEAEFWQLYESKYSILLEKTRSYLKAQTDRLRASSLNSKAAIFLSAGFDASEWEGEGMQRHKVNVPTEFYARLTRDVVKIAAEEGTSVEGRIISVLEGGYSDRALCSGVFSHLGGLAGDDPAPIREQESNGLGYEMGSRIGMVRGRKDSSASERGTRRYEPSWWSAAELEKLETAMVSPPPPPKKPRSTTPPTYSSPTQSSIAKVVAAPSVRRSMSGVSGRSTPVPISRAPTPPPPEVPWTIATHELSKLLIPSERQTDSCKHEDLNAEAMRVRRGKQSALSQSLPPGSLPPAAPPADRPSTRMALRERKPKPAILTDDFDEEKERKNRRRTVAGSSVLATEKAGSRSSTPVPADKPARQPGRRLSAASTIMSESIDINMHPPPLLPPNGVSRPPSSMTVRPESSMSVRTTAGGPLNVKKTRAPSRKEPVPRASRAQKKTPPATSNGTASAGLPKASVSAVVDKPAAPVTSDGTADEMESLANNMKKIKITLLTKEQREIRERERLAKEDAAKAKKVAVTTPVEENKPLVLPDQTPQALLIPPTTIPPNSAPPKLDSTPDLPFEQSMEESVADLPTGPSTPAPLRAPTLNPRPAPFGSSSPAPSSSPRSPTRSPARSPSRAAAPPQSDVFISYQPEGPTPAALPVAQQQPLQWLPPNTATPAAMKRMDLPVFTATSAIPFAPRPASAAGVKSEAHLGFG